jgi:hypothetical protein
MTLIRCTCIYRASTAAERRDGKAAITVAFADPWCPATTSHERSARAGALAAQQRRC